MRIRSKAVGALLVLSIGASAAQAATQPMAPPTPARVAVFTVMGDEIETPLPDGLCEARGKLVATAQITAAIDKDNLTLMSLYDCAAMERDELGTTFALIKAPHSALREKVTLAELLKAMGVIPETEMAALMASDELTEGAETQVSKILGFESDIAAKVQPVGTDDHGYYMAGVVTFQAQDTTVRSAVAVALTSVKGHVITYNFYQPGADARAVAAALRRVKAETRRLIKANGG